MKKQTIIAALLLATTMSHGKTTPNRTETPANFEGYLFAYYGHENEVSKGLRG